MSSYVSVFALCVGHVSSGVCRMRKEESEWKRALQIHTDEMDTEEGLALPLHSVPNLLHSLHCPPQGPCHQVGR